MQDLASDAQSQLRAFAIKCEMCLQMWTSVFPELIRLSGACALYGHVTTCRAQLLEMNANKIVDTVSLSVCCNYKSQYYS